jgi:hypothetical protein
LGVNGVPPGPANAGGLNNSANDPSGAANAANVRTAPGTNSAGTAQSSGSGVNTAPGVTTGAAGTGTMATNPASVDAAIAEENKTIDRRLNSICRGC